MTHLKAKRGAVNVAKRLEQIEQLLRLQREFEAVAPTADVKIVMGDFNADADEPLFDRLALDGLRVAPLPTWTTAKERIATSFDAGGFVRLNLC